MENKLIVNREHGRLSELNGSLIQPGDEYKHHDTHNESFINVSKQISGIKNNKFMLALYDRDLEYIDPHDKDLSVYFKAKVLAECARNIWYYLREVIRIPQLGSNYGMRYTLNRSNLAMISCHINSINNYTTTPRQQYSTITQTLLVSYEYIFNDKCNISLRDKSNDDSQFYMKRLKSILDMLPDYIKKSDLANINDNKISIIPAYKTEKEIIAGAKDITSNIIFLNDFEFMKHPTILHDVMLPARIITAMNCKKNNVRAVLSINSSACNKNLDDINKIVNMINLSCRWDDIFYDMPLESLRKHIDENSINGITYIEFSYKELGLDEKWYTNMCNALMNDEEIIKREILLERM